MSHHRVQVEGVAERLHDAMVDSGMSMFEIARNTGIPYSNVRYHANGISSLSIYALARYCEVLHINADWVIFGRKERKSV